MKPNWKKIHRTLKSMKLVCSLDDVDDDDAGDIDYHGFLTRNVK